MAENDYAVLVGISRYPALRDLSGPVNDALSVEHWLLTRGGVPPGHIELIVTPNGAETMTRKTARPLRDQVINALDAILETENESGKAGRRLYLYLAGHGYAPQVNDAALLMANAGGRSFPAVPGAQFANWFRASAKFEEIVLIMDCCREEYGAIPPQPLPWPDDVSPDAGSVRYFYAFATQPFLYAREKMLLPDGRVRGIFTYALLTAFESAAPDAAGRVTGAAVKDYVLNFMKSVIETQYQEPEIPIDSAKDIVLWHSDAAPTLPVQLPELWTVAWKPSGPARSQPPGCCAGIWRRENIASTPPMQPAVNASTCWGLQGR
jgi:hypothetical protein